MSISTACIEVRRRPEMGGLATSTPDTRPVSSAHRGFTLLELCVALAIGAILTAVAWFSLLGPYRTASLAAGVEQVELFDQLVRSHSRRTARTAQLTIELGTGTLVETESQPEPSTRQLALGPGLKIDRLEFLDKRLSHGRATVPISSEGHSPTYALRLRGVNEQTQWILFAGVTGQSVKLSNENHVRQLFDELASRRADAN